MSHCFPVFRLILRNKEDLVGDLNARAETARVVGFLGVAVLRLLCYSCLWIVIPFSMLPMISCTLFGFANSLFKWNTVIFLSWLGFRIPEGLLSLMIILVSSILRFCWTFCCFFSLHLFILLLYSTWVTIAFLYRFMCEDMGLPEASLHFFWFCHFWTISVDLSFPEASILRGFSCLWWFVFFRAWFPTCQQMNFSI